MASEAEEDENDFWTHFAEGSFLPTLVLKLVLKVIPTQAPFLVSSILRIAMDQVQKRFTDPDVKRKIAFTATALEKRSPDGRAWFAGGDKDGNPTAADFQMLFAIEAITSPSFDSSEVPESLRNWVDMAHKRPAYMRAYEKGGEYDYAKL